MPSTPTTFASPEYSTAMAALTVTVPITLGEGTQYWRVRTVNSLGWVSGWYGGGSFRILNGQ